MSPGAHFESAKKHQILHFRTEDFEKAIRGLAPEKQAFARMLFPKDATGKWMKTNQAKLEVFAEKLAPHERALLSVRIMQSKPQLLPGRPPSEGPGPKLRRPVPEPGPRAGRPAQEPGPQVRRPTPEPKPQASRPTQEPVPQQASRPARERAPQQASNRPAQEQAPQQAARRPAQEQAPQQTSNRPAQEQAPQQASNRPAQEQAPQQATSRPAQEQAPQQATSRPAQEQAPQQATSQPAHEAENTHASGSTPMNAPDRPNHSTSAGDQTPSQPTDQDGSESKPKGIMGWVSSLSTTRKIVYGGLAFFSVLFLTQKVGEDKDKDKAQPKNGL